MNYSRSVVETKEQRSCQVEIEGSEYKDCNLQVSGGMGKKM